jgi:hypothetical protein
MVREVCISDGKLKTTCFFEDQNQVLLSSLYRGLDSIFQNYLNLFLSKELEAASTHPEKEL